MIGGRGSSLPTVSSASLASLEPSQLAALVEDAQADWWRTAAERGPTATQLHQGWSITEYDTAHWQQVNVLRNLLGKKGS